MGAATVTAIVPEYDERSDAIDRTLRAILGQTRPPEKVVLVDDASPAGPPTIEPDIRDRVGCMSLEINGGVSAARNHGAAVTDTDYLLFTNCDVELAADWVEKATRFMEQSPSAGAVSGRIVPANGSQVMRAWRLQHIETKVHRTTIGEPAKQRWLVGHVMFVRRSAFDQVGGFDPEYRRAGDDPDLCQRLEVAGWENYHLPGLTAVSHEAATIEYLARKCVRNSGWNLRRHCAPCKAVKPLRPIRASLSTIRLLGEHVVRDVGRRRFRFLPVDFAVAGHSLRLIWCAAINGI